MSRITDNPRILALAEPGEEPWEGFDDEHVLMQKPCPDPECHGGLLYAPARFHGRCDGRGLVVRVVRLPWLPPLPERDYDDEDD